MLKASVIAAALLLGGCTEAVHLRNAQTGQRRAGHTKMASSRALGRHSVKRAASTITSVKASSESRRGNLHGQETQIPTQ